MAERHFNIDPDIRKAETLPGYFYKDPNIFEAIKEKVFARSWQWIGHQDQVSHAHNAHPFVLLDDYLSEPMLLTKDSGGALHCLSNVCTHRANLVLDEKKNTKKLICGYHGRRFSLDGAFEHMPEFKEAADFPRACDSLYKFPLRNWGPFLFAGLNPAFDFQQTIDSMNERVGFLPLEEFRWDPERSKAYSIAAHWALYCDNYLEGFHIPFVHEDLNAVLDYGDYDTLLFDHMNLQIGYADPSEEVFDLPEGHVDYGKSIAAYYFWVFPNMMFNFYPWGLSVNIVEPKDQHRTTVRFLSYVYQEGLLDKGAGAILDKVELEDEAVVEGVQKGLRSRFYQAGRFSPTRETGVHHFHRLLAHFLAK